MFNKSLKSIQPKFRALLSISLLKRDANDIHQSLHKCLFYRTTWASRWIRVSCRCLIWRRLPSHSINEETWRSEAEPVRGSRGLLGCCNTWGVLLVHQHFNIICIVGTFIFIQEQLDHILFDLDWVLIDVKGLLDTRVCILLLAIDRLMEEWI